MSEDYKQFKEVIAKLKISATWTSNGKKIKYSDLTDSHLKNIIKDGYRNYHITMEANKREFEIPVRQVDLLSFEELMMHIEAFNSCAISGNEIAEGMFRL